jgi:short-subunit dehydrogenase
MAPGLTGRTAVVGGASAGLGAAVAESLAAEGCRLLLWARNRERLQATAQRLGQAPGVEVETLAADAADPARRRKPCARPSLSRRRRRRRRTTR